MPIEGHLTREAGELLRFPPAIRRAAYSDRTAWLMALFAELAYVRFEVLERPDLEKLAREIAAADGQDAIIGALATLARMLEAGNASENEVLERVLSAAGFELVGTFYNKSLDPMKNTEGFVAKRVRNDERDFAVLAIRGTTSVQDWWANARVGLEGIEGGGKVHKGFHGAYLDARPRIDALLSKIDSLPLFVTGHSLGGAVAVMATWYRNKDGNAACYTFGAPRVGNHVFNEAFRTPIYRVVNAWDPVPLVPPSGLWIDVLELVLRLVGKVFGQGLVDELVKLLSRVQGYRHAGDLRHFTAGEADEQGRYPDVEMYTSFGVIDRVKRLAHSFGKLKRLDTYHSISIYRRKLRSRALDRNPFVGAPRS